MAIIVHTPEDGWNGCSDPTAVCGRELDINETVELAADVWDDEDPDEIDAIPDHVWGAVTPMVGPEAVYGLGLSPCGTCDPQWDVYAGRAGMY